MAACKALVEETMSERVLVVVAEIINEISLLIVKGNQPGFIISFVCYLVEFVYSRQFNSSKSPRSARILSQPKPRNREKETMLCMPRVRSGWFFMQESHE
jgi:hypothetical protein